VQALRHTNVCKYIITDLSNYTRHIPRYTKCILQYCPREQIFSHSKVLLRVISKFCGLVDIPPKLNPHPKGQKNADHINWKWKMKSQEVKKSTSEGQLPYKRIVKKGRCTQINRVCNANHVSTTASNVQCSHGIPTEE